MSTTETRPETLEEILDDARNYMKMNKYATFNTYENFKHRLWDAGIYGQENVLVRILKI